MRKIEESIMKIVSRRIIRDECIIIFDSETIFCIFSSLVRKYPVCPTLSTPNASQDMNKRHFKFVSNIYTTDKVRFVTLFYQRFR